jgi:hypothetical protein
MHYYKINQIHSIIYENIYPYSSYNHINLFLLIIIIWNYMS